MASSSSSSSSSSLMAENSLMVENTEVREIDNAFLISLLQDSPILDDQNVDQDDVRLMHVIQSLEAEISPVPIMTSDYFSDTESSTASDDYSSQSMNQMNGQDCSMDDDIDLSWIDMEMVTSLDCGDSDMSLGYMDESYVRDDEFCNVDYYAQGYRYGVQMDQGYDYSETSMRQES